MVVRHNIEEVEARICAGRCIGRLPARKAILTMNNKSPPRCGKVLNMSQNTKEIPVWVGGESGQRKRYLKSLEKDLAAELGPDWRNVIELAKDS